MKKTTWIVRTAVCLALLLVLQVATKSLGQFVTGSCVNLVLGVSTLVGGVWCGAVVALVMIIPSVVSITVLHILEKYFP